MNLLNRLIQTLSDTGRGLLFWLLVIIGGGLLVFALRGTQEQTAPLSSQPVNPIRPGLPTSPPPPTNSTASESNYPDTTPFPSPVPPPVGSVTTGRPEGSLFPTVTPPDFDPAHLTQSPTPVPPPTRTPIVPHTHGAFGLVGVSDPIGGELEAIITGIDHLFVLAENTLASLTNNNPVAPTVTGRIPLPEKETAEISRLAIHGPNILVAHRDAGLILVDASDPARMRILGTYWPKAIADRPDLIADEVTQVVMEGSLAYVLSEFCPPGCPMDEVQNVIDVLDLSDPAEPLERTRIVYPGREPVLAVHLPYLIMGDGDGRLHIWTWSGDELMPVGEPVQLTLAEGTGGWGIDSLQSASGDRLHVISSRTWWIISLSENGSRIEDGPIELYASYDGGLLLNGRMLLYDSHLGGLHLLDISDPAGIRDLGAYGPAWGLPHTGYTQHFAVTGALIYALDGNGSINVLQVQAP